MLRIIIAILLCGILVYSTDNNLKALAIVCLLIQAYSDTRGKKKEGFENNNNKKSKNISEIKNIDEFKKKIEDADIKKNKNRVNKMSENVIDLIFKDDPDGCLNKVDLIKKVQSQNFIDSLQKNALSFI